MFIKLLLCMFISLVNASSWITWINPWAEPTPKKVCYGDLGCFSNEYPFSNANEYLPQDPTKIGLELLLFTRQNRYMPNNFTGGIGNYFKRDKSIKVIVHGYYSKATTEWVIEMKDAFLQKEDCNVVLLDWSKAAFSYYNQAVADTRVAGALAAMYINNTMNHYKVKSSEIHIVGFSLGAHIAGYIGSSIKGLGRITGLDPAGPDFESTDPEVRLDPSDARFVDVIHTDSDHILNIELSPGFGTSQPMGHVDFYVNGGKNQPGCPTYGHQTSAEYILSNMYSAFGKTYESCRHTFAQSNMDLDSGSFICGDAGIAVVPDSQCSSCHCETFNNEEIAHTSQQVKTALASASSAFLA